MLRHHSDVLGLGARRLALVAALGLAASLATTGLSGGATPLNGLYGLVKKGPIVPVCREGEPCDAPVQVTLVFSRRGKAVARTRSRKDGSYRIGLAAGIYAVRTVERIGIARNLTPHNVKVRRGHWDRINFHIDTGIR